jgi:hypothetical protein
MRLLEVKKSGKEIHILYFGDFDPSGNNMDGQFAHRTKKKECFVLICH